MEPSNRTQYYRQQRASRKRDLTTAVKMPDAVKVEHGYENAAAAAVTGQDDVDDEVVILWGKFLLTSIS